MGGVVSSTFLTLFVVPAAFYRFERHRFATESDPSRPTARAEAPSSVASGVAPEGASSGD